MSLLSNVLSRLLPMRENILVLWMQSLSAVILAWGSLVVQTVRNMPAMRETQFLSLHLKGPLEKGMGTHSSILAWRIPWTEEPGWLQSM